MSNEGRMGDVAGRVPTNDFDICGTCHDGDLWSRSL